MNRFSSNELIDAVRAEKLPESPGDLADRVLRRIREARSAANTGRWRDVLDMAFRPSLVAAGLVLALTVGAVTTTVAGELVRPGKKPTDPFGFELFSRPEALECHYCICPQCKFWKPPSS